MMLRRVRVFWWTMFGVLLSLLVVSAAAVAAGDANEAFCPNETLESFRATLPDCRAYELVTPPYKEGALLKELDAVSPDGSRAILTSFGDFGEAQGEPGLGSTYELTRGSSGWTETGIDLPAFQFPWDRFLDATPDLSSTLWEAREASQSLLALDFWVRESDGALHDLGPLLPPSETVGPPGLGPPPGLSPAGTFVTYRGASNDLSRILFTSAEGRWPGDTTQQEADSLYEYTAGQGGPPVAVGVGDGGSLIGECGVDLGSTVAGGGRSSSAVSADGSVVFFTVRGKDDEPCPLSQPTVDELFARIDGSSTVAISEPSSNAGWCTEVSCVENTSAANEAADFRDAEYVGASSDGSKVFFTSTQQLTNGASEDGAPSDSATVNKGLGCGETSGPGGCNLYEAELGEEPITKEPHLKHLALLSGGSPDPQVQGVVSVSEDGSHVYFVAKGVLTGSETNKFGDTAHAGKNNLYVAYPAGTVTFIATLTSESKAELEAKEAESCTPLAEPENKECVERLEREFKEKNSLDAADWGGGEGKGAATATPEGRFLVFPSVAHLTPDDTSTARQIFRYDSQTGELVRVSIGEGGFNDDGNTDTLPAGIPFNPVAVGRVARLPYAISFDGAFVVFQSADGLTPGALNAQPTSESGTFAQNVYEYHDGGVSLISDGQDTSTVGENESSVRVDGMTGSGGDIFFRAADPLVPRDGDTQVDLYDARVDGGFPFEQSPVGCQGDGCQGALTEAPVLSSPGSASYSGPGNVPPKINTAAKPKAPSTRTRKLKQALKTCHAKKNKHKRDTCEGLARKKYEAKAKAQFSKGGKRS